MSKTLFLNRAFYSAKGSGGGGGQLMARIVGIDEIFTWMRL